MVRSLFFIFLFFYQYAYSQTIGDFHQGGVVFYVDSSGGGLIVDIQDLLNPSPLGNTSLDSLLSRWGNYATHVPGTSSPAIGSGYTNTQNFINFYAVGNYAAHQCYNSNNQGFNDWFLPSKNELEEIFFHGELIDSISLINGGHLFADLAPLYPYWSSTESPSTTDFRDSYAVYSSGFSLLRGKILEYKVRAVRAFTINTSVLTPLHHNEKNILKIVDMMGQESSKRTNSIQLYIFDDGSVEKRMIIE
tara:strand:- start:356 stop:1099 length:744 start_codon:yes stop_codon:yes gene_type:complete